MMISPIVPESVAKAARSRPDKLLKERFKELNSREQAIVSRPLEMFCDPTGFIPDDIWVGCSNPQSSPRHVVTGVCQGKLLDEKKLWLDLGPSLETVIGLDNACRLATQFQAQFHIWIVDNEYANNAARDGDDAQQLELTIGTSLIKQLGNRYPRASLHRTSDARVRANLYATMSAPALSRLYPEGIPKPYGLNPTLWDQLDYLSCVASFLVVGEENDPVLAIVDHEQYRAVCAARLVRRSVDALLFWPAPHLYWRRPNSENPNIYLPEIKKRRMHNTMCIGGKLFLNDTIDRVRTRASQCKREADISEDAIGELARMVFPVDPSICDKFELLEKVLLTLQKGAII